MRARLVPLAEETNSVSTEGISADAIKTTRRVLLAMIENLAKEELDYGAVPAISTSSKKHAAHGTTRGKASPCKASRLKALGTNP